MRRWILNQWHVPSLTGQSGAVAERAPVSPNQPTACREPTRTVASPRSALHSLVLWRRRGVGMRLVPRRVKQECVGRVQAKPHQEGCGGRRPCLGYADGPERDDPDLRPGGGTPGPTTTVPRLSCTEPSVCGDPRFCGACVCVSTTDGDNACIDQSSVNDLCSSPGPGPQCRPGFECFCPDGVCGPGVCVRFCSSSADCGPGAVCATNLLCSDPRSICFPLGSSELCSGVAHRADTSNWGRAFGGGH